MFDKKTIILISAGVFLVLVCIAIGERESGDNRHPDSPLPESQSKKPMPQSQDDQSDEEAMLAKLAKEDSDVKRERAEQVAEKSPKEAADHRETEEVRLPNEGAKRSAAAAKEDEENRIGDIWRLQRKNFIAVDGEVLSIDPNWRQFDLDGFTTIQVVDDRNLLADLVGGRGIYWLSEVNTRGLVDQSFYNSSGYLVGGGKSSNPFVRIGTKRYATVTGGTRTVMHAIPAVVVEQGISLADFRKALDRGLVKDLTR